MYHVPTNDGDGDTADSTIFPTNDRARFWNK